MPHDEPPTPAELIDVRAAEVLARCSPGTVPTQVLMGEWFDAGLCWVHFPRGLGGLGVTRDLQPRADRLLVDAGGPEPRSVNTIGYALAAPTLLAHAPTELTARLLRPLATGEQRWCQLFSEPGAGSDLAGLATRAVRDGDDWVVNGQKVWSSLAHLSSWAVLVTRTDPDVPKHRGLTYFVVDMTSPGIEVRPLRQLTGQSDFNEVFLTDVRIPDAQRLGDVGAGWQVARSTLANERSAIGDRAIGRDSGTIADALELWRAHPERHDPVLRARLAQLWSRAEIHRLTGQRARVNAATAAPGPESSILKVVGSELNQAIYEFCMEMLGPAALLYGSYDHPDAAADTETPIQRRFLRSRANTIEGGTSEILRNIIGERVLGLPTDLREDRDRPWREVPRS